MVPLVLTVTCGASGLGFVGMLTGAEKLIPSFVEWLKNREAPSASQATITSPLESTYAEGVWLQDPAPAEMLTADVNVVPSVEELDRIEQFVIVPTCVQKSCP